jgi:hypothetical protein
MRDAGGSNPSRIPSVPRWVDPRRRFELARRHLCVRRRVILESLIICPICGISKSATMPIDACRLFYECTGCGTLLRPRTGDCCVFCSYGSVACPPVQRMAARRNTPSGPRVAERPEIVKLALRNENKAMAQGQRRKIEIFSAGCAICTETVELVRRIAGAQQPASLPSSKATVPHAIGSDR